MVLPLVATAQLFGQLTICGERNGQPLCDDVNLLLELIEPFEVRLQTLTEPHNVATRDQDLRRLDIRAGNTLSIVNWVASRILPGVCVLLGLFTFLRRRR